MRQVAALRQKKLRVDYDCYPVHRRGPHEVPQALHSSKSWEFFFVGFVLMLAKLVVGTGTLDVDILNLLFLVVAHWV